MYKIQIGFPGYQNVTLTVLVFGPESVSYERSRRETAAKFHHFSARVFFVKISKSQDSMIYTIFSFFRIHIPKMDSFPMLFSHPTRPPVRPSARHGSQVIKLVRVPVFLSSQVIKMVRVPVFISSQVIKLVRFPVFPGSQVIKLVRVPVFPCSKLNQNDSFSSISSFPNYFSINYSKNSAPISVSALIILRKINDKIIF